MNKFGWICLIMIVLVLVLGALVLFRRFVIRLQNPQMPSTLWVPQDKREKLFPDVTPVYTALSKKRLDRLNEMPPGWKLEFNAGSYRIRNAQGVLEAWIWDTFSGKQELTIIPNNSNNPIDYYFDVHRLAWDRYDKQQHDQSITNEANWKELK